MDKLHIRSSNGSSSKSLAGFEEHQLLTDALEATMYIMNDDIETAEQRLMRSDSTFHKLGLGFVSFLRATLGFEQDVMKEASKRVGDIESSAYNAQTKAAKDPNSFRSKIYPVGTEYALCNAEAQLMSAVIGVLNESLTESIKGFYKLRKAFITLDGILKSESSFTKESAPPLAPDAATGELKAQENGHLTNGGKDVNGINYHHNDCESEDDEFYDADDASNGTTTTTEYSGHFESASQPNSPRPSTSTSISTTPSPRMSRADAPKLLRNHSLLAIDPSAFAHPIDSFIYSGSNAYFGMLQILVSLIPPAFSKLASIVGFRGNRDRGLDMLWRASHVRDLNGSMAGLVYLGFYNGLYGLMDIVPKQGSNGYPIERCRSLLREMRSRYPESRLWLLEEARRASADCELERAVDIVQAGGGKASPLKQVEALQWFETSLNSMYLHRYQACADGFLKCVELNNWSHGLYYYIAAVCHVELYRLYKNGGRMAGQTSAEKEPSVVQPDAEKAKKHAAEADRLLAKVIPNAGKKKILAGKLPFDVFITRKIHKWTDRSKAMGVSLIDAVGVSPIEEMIYFWSGYARMRPVHLEFSLERLDGHAKNPGWTKEAVDERCMLQALKAAVLRHLRRTEDARDILREEIMDSHNWSEFKGGNKDNWPAPIARYETAVTYWLDYEALPADEKSSSEGKGLLKACQRYIEEVANWESYDLEARMGVKVTAGRETMKRLKVTS